MTAFLEGLDWRGEPWGESLRGAGLYAAMVLSGSVKEDWESAYFQWLLDNADPETGLWRAGCILGTGGESAGAPLFHHIA